MFNYQCGSLISVLRMKEKAISGMMATVRRRHTDVEEGEERISHLKRVIRWQLLNLCVDYAVCRRLKNLREKE